MHLPHTLLKLGAAATCWVMAGVVHDAPRSSVGAVEPHNPLAICRSAYGSLIARLMKDSLHSYWHAGCTDPNHDHGTSPLAGRFASRSAPASNRVQGRHDHDHDHDVDEHGHEAGHETPASPTSRLSWVDRLGRSVSQIEHMRSVRNSPFAVAAAHRKFLSASADWRVHVAWELDPGDSALYEIDHFVSVSSAPSAQAAKRKAEELAQRTIQHALSPQAGPVEALTGAGAAINLLNDELRPNRANAPKTERLLRDWRTLSFCLKRHRDLREQADEQDWWNDIPEVRRQEIETYATMLTRLSDMIGKQLATNGALGAGAR